MEEKRYIRSYHIEEKQYCKMHDCKMVQIPCTMFVYCLHCHNEEYFTNDIKNKVKGE